MNQPRQPKGTPTGGQFSALGRQEAVGHLLVTEPSNDDLADLGRRAQEWFDHPPSLYWKALQADLDAGRITPEVVENWRDYAKDMTERKVPRFSPERAAELTALVDDIESAARQRGLALSQDEFIEMADWNPPSIEDYDALWDAYRSSGERPDEFCYQHIGDWGIQHYPCPPVGTVIDNDRARTLPAYTIIEARFDHASDRVSRLMARDMPRWGERDAHLHRRFTNLDSGTEVFVGGNDAPEGYPKGQILEAVVIEQP